MANTAEDESLVVDLLLGALEEEQARLVRERIEKEADLKQLYDDMSHTLLALDRLPEPDSPEELVEKTLSRIKQDEHLKTLLARQEVSKRVYRPTFSLRELAAMAAVALMMATVFIPSIRQAKQHELINECSAQMGQIGSAMSTFAMANGNRLPQADPQKKRWMGAAEAEQSAVASNSIALFRLVSRGYARPPLFQCPAVGGGTFVAKSGMVDFPASRYVSYSYQHAVGSGAICVGDQCLSGRESKMAILADATPVFQGGQFHPELANDSAASENHRGAGENVLFMDWHVGWCDKPTAGVSGNNIYLVDNVFDYHGDELPATPTDSFLLPAYSGR